MASPVTGMRELRAVEVPAAIRTLPPLPTYLRKASSKDCGRETTSDRTTKAYFVGSILATRSAVTLSRVKAVSAAAPSAELKYSGERESAASWTNRTCCGSDLSTANKAESSAGNTSAESIFTSQRVK